MDVVVVVVVVCAVHTDTHRCVISVQFSKLNVGYGIAFCVFRLLCVFLFYLRPLCSCIILFSCDRCFCFNAVPVDWPGRRSLR